MNKNFIENVCYLATKNNIAYGPILREVENVYDYENNFKCVRVSHTTKLRKEYLNFSEEMLSTMSMSEIDDMIDTQKNNLFQKCKEDGMEKHFSRKSS